jgi:hypothetical protein
LLSGPGLDSLCLTAGFEWAPEARADVNLLERQAAFARKTARPTSEDSATAAFRWSVPPSTRPGLPRSLSATMPVARETLTWWARRALVVEWARLLGQDRSRENDTTDAGLVHLAAWLRELADDPLPPGIDEASVALETSLEVASRTASFGFDLQTPLWRLMRALTGAVRHRVSDGVCKPASAAPAGFDLDLPSAAGRLSCVLSAIGSDLPGAVDPRTCFLRPDAWVVPSVLPLPASYLAGQGPGATALVTPHLAQASWAVDATGHLAEQAPWPHPIIGEERGPRGLAVAWSNAGSWYLMRRASATEPADVVTVPFRPARAVVLDDGSCLWTATTGGLWRWDTDGRVERVATVPPVSGITLTEAGVRLDPIAKDVAGHGHRSAREHGWLWNPGSPGVTELDLGPLGQACRRAGSGRKWAAAYPAADLIQVGDASGHRFDVACDWPNDIAWAGDSLVAVTAQGTVLLFAGLAELLG